MLGGFVLARLVSWLLRTIPWTRGAYIKLAITHGATLALLILLQLVIKAPLGIFHLTHAVVLLPGVLFWLCYDLAMLGTRKKPRKVRVKAAREAR
jgi:hypothetical protein